MPVTYSTPTREDFEKFIEDPRVRLAFEALFRLVETGGSVEFMGRPGGLAAGVTAYVGAGDSTTEAHVTVPWPRAGTFKNMYVVVDTAPTAGRNVTFTFRKNGADQALTAAIADTAVAASDTTNTVTVAAGDLVSIKVVASASAATTRPKVGLQFLPS